MTKLFAYSCIGYSHIKGHKPCQDYSATYKDENRQIITCCDGHGGDSYVRSQRGSKMASLAVRETFKGLSLIELNQYSLSDIGLEELAERVRVNLLCAWNRRVEEDLLHNPLQDEELTALDEAHRLSLSLNPVKAYGTTLTGAMVIGDKLMVVKIGDSEVMGVKNGQLTKLLDDDNDPVANITYSMCQEDAADYIRVALYDTKTWDAIILCTDGLSSPYQSYTNFQEYFAKPLVKTALTSTSDKEIRHTINEIALFKGYGDDVSLAFLITDSCNQERYLTEA